MLDITKLNDIDYVMKNIFNIYNLHKELGKIIDTFKEQVKTNGQSYEGDGGTIKYISTNKLVPTDWESLLKQYPVEQYRDIYDIRLSAKAGEVITDESLVHYEPIESVRFNIKDSINEHKSDNAREVSDV